MTNELQPIVYNSQRVLTTSQLAESFGADSKIINRNFQRNSERYVQGKHYFSLSGDELKEFKGSRQIDESLKFASVLYLWTEKGAWLHAKSLNTDEAWEAYELLVDEYYRVQQQVKVLTEAEQIKASMKLSLLNSDEIVEVKKEVAEVRSMVQEQITLDYGEQRRVQKGISIRIYDLTNDPDVRKNILANYIVKSRIDSQLLLTRILSEKTCKQH